MPGPNNNKRRHFILQETSKALPYISHSAGGGDKPQIPDLPRGQHGNALLAQIQSLKPLAEEAKRFQQAEALTSGLGLQVQFCSFPDIELAFEKLAREASGIELLNTKAGDHHTYATVFVPDGKLDRFEQMIADYLADKKDKNGRPRDNKGLLNTIQAIRAAEIQALWTDDYQLLPSNQDEAFWWEAWLPVRNERAKVVEDFRTLARGMGLTLSTTTVDFPERTVILMFGSQRQLSHSVAALNCVAELRRAKETAEFFDALPIQEQYEWIQELQARLTFPEDADSVPRVCILDTGVNRGHPLLSPLMKTEDLYAVHPDWGVDDSEGHGTELAGLTAFGNLTIAMDSPQSVEVLHRLESVKLLRIRGDNAGTREHHAALFTDAIAQPEIVNPNRPRIFSSAVTTADNRDRGRPSAWSAKIDALAADTDGNGAFPRLIVLSAGNSTDINGLLDYPYCCSTELIHDPGQAWNGLTVGAYTELDQIVEADAQHYTPLAQKGGISPLTSTSATWEKAWPIKPDVVFEGGNVGYDKLGAAQITSLSLLTTGHQPQQRLLTWTNATSAACALCARMAAQLMAAYPELRPDTIRALIVHSAEWTENMREMFLPAKPKVPTKNDYLKLTQHCGFGVPNLERALWSAGNSLTLVAEDEIHPFRKKGSDIKTRDMKLHTLPWPKEELEALGDVPVEMRVTLSYFIEPNPSARGAQSKYHYASHRLRFDVRRSLEPIDDFIARINAASETGDKQGNAKDPDWLLGEKNRTKGSIHTDVWRGTAADLANRGFLAIYPANGWWRTRPKQRRYNLPAKYSLIVSISTPEVGVDLYAVVESVVKTTVEV